MQIIARDRPTQDPTKLDSALKKIFNTLRIKRLKNRWWTTRHRLLQANRQLQGAVGQRIGAGVFHLGERYPGLLATVLLPLRVIAPCHLRIAQMHAVLTARRSGWREAAPLSRRMRGWNPGRPPSLPQFLLAPPDPAQTGRVVAPRADRPRDVPIDLARRIVVYTTCFGTRPYLLPIMGQPEGLRFLCFTDVPIDCPGWEVIVTDRRIGHDAFAAICPHRLLSEVAPEAEYSLFLENGMMPVGNLHNLFTRWLLHQDIALWQHSAVSDWHALAEHELLTGRCPAAAIMAQAAACEAAGVPRDRGAHDTGMIWRRHADPSVKAMMEAWWALHESEPEGDPALSLYRLTQEEELPADSIAHLPGALGTSKKNIFFARNLPGLTALRPRLPSPGVRTGKIPITFLYAEQRLNSGITLMRARQLSQMVASTYPDRYDVTLCSDIDSVRDQVVIVNRGAIEFNPLVKLADLKKRNIVSISDWLDLPIRAIADQVFDAQMTLCLPQTVALNRRFPTTPAFHVTHHVNPSVPHCNGPTDRLRTGYFGRLANTSRPESLENEIDLVNVVDANFTAQDWARLAPLYNCHWVVRQLDDLQEWKPFLKGFVAARCGAVVIVTRDDMNAVHYLGDDYPFYANSMASADLERAWARASSSFGGEDWVNAQAIMRQVKARSSDRQVMVEFKAMLDEILA